MNTYVNILQEKSHKKITPLLYIELLKKKKILRLH